MNAEEIRLEEAREQRRQTMKPEIVNVAEQKRLNEAREAQIPWKKWGPYLSERQWGTVREDYSENGDAWNFFTHDQARSRAYRWGEDGIAGISDDKQHLCFALALWNGKDPILKERLFGLTTARRTMVRMSKSTTSTSTRRRRTMAAGPHADHDACRR